MDSGKVAAECETHRRHAICSADTAGFVSARFSRFVQNGSGKYLPLWKYSYADDLLARARSSRFSVFHSGGERFLEPLFWRDGLVSFQFSAPLCWGKTSLNPVFMFYNCFFFLQPRRSPTCSASAEDRGLRSRVSSCWSSSISSS